MLTEDGDINFGKRMYNFFTRNKEQEFGEDLKDELPAEKVSDETQKLLEELERNRIVEDAIARNRTL